jgi:hypothetical protein
VEKKGMYGGDKIVTCPDDRLKYLKVCGVILVNKKEQKSKEPDKYFVDPFTGFAMCLTCAERRRKKRNVWRWQNCYLPMIDLNF